MQWRSFWENNYLKKEFIVSLLILIISLLIFTEFLDFNENRNGITLADPILHFFNAVNLTWLIFALIYISLAAILIYIIRFPDKLVFVMQCYSLLLFIRMVMMFLMPLNPPNGMIVLNDPVVQLFGTGQMLTKDLFFSGHTATIFLFYLVTTDKKLKTFFLVSTVMVAISVIVQHVHYAVDVASAPFFSYLSYRLVYLYRKSFN